MASKFGEALQKERMEKAQAEFHASVNDRLQSLEEKIDQLIALMSTNVNIEGVTKSIERGVSRATYKATGKD